MIVFFAKFIIGILAGGCIASAVKNINSCAVNGIIVGNTAKQNISNQNYTKNKGRFKDATFTKNELDRWGK